MSQNRKIVKTENYKNIASNLDAISNKSLRSDIKITKPIKHEYMRILCYAGLFMQCQQQVPLLKMG